MERQSSPEERGIACAEAVRALSNNYPDVTFTITTATDLAHDFDRWSKALEEIGQHEDQRDIQFRSIMDYRVTITISGKDEEVLRVIANEIVTMVEYKFHGKIESRTAPTRIRLKFLSRPLSPIVKIVAKFS
jgi:hypothetical protein